MKKINYTYYVVPLGEDAYKAVIPKFDNLLIMADTLEELNDMVDYTIKMDIENRKKDGRPIPIPDNDTKFNGKILLRVKSDLHEKLFHEAKANKISLNKHIERKLRA